MGQLLNDEVLREIGERYKSMPEWLRDVFESNNNHKKKD